jgi:alpha-L-rhamnosidase
MQKPFVLLSLTALSLTFLSMGAGAQQLSVNHLRCVSSEAPVGVESPAPGLNWELRSAGRGVLQTAYRVLVSDNPSLLEKNVGNLWDSRRTVTGASIHVIYKGTPLKAAKTYYWKVMVWDNQGRQSAWSPVATWQMGLLKPADWKGAAWIAYEALPDTAKLIPGGKKPGKGERVPRDILPLFRKAFTVRGPVKKATAYISGLGQFELSINGEKTGDHFLDPGWTRYEREALYVPLDITTQLKVGENALGIALGNGFLYTPTERYHKLTGVYGYPKVIGLVRIEYQDGTTAEIVTDSSWRTAPSPVIFSSIYGGEDYDAELEQAGWNKPSFDETAWRKVIRVDGPPLHAQQEPPLLVSEIFNPQRILRVGPLREKAVKGEAVYGDAAQGAAWTYDLGQNISGIVRLTVRGHKGDTIRIIPGELIHEDGSANQRATGSPYYFTYILKGEGDETWEPRFSYYGFRYLQVDGAVPKDSAGANGSAAPKDNAGAENSAAPKGRGNLPVLLNLQGLHTGSEGTPVGSFTCSNDLFNRINELIRWSIRNNMASVLTDCPTREKLGWLEQTHLMGNSVQYNYDLSGLYRKTVHDMMVAQTTDGLVPEIAPEFTLFGDPFRDSPEWGSASIILPWNLYQWYGDKGIVQESYSMMKSYMAYLDTKANRYILSQGLGDWYDLGPAKPGFSQLTPKGLTATAFYYYDATILQQVATLLGKTADAQQYAVLAGHIRRAFNESFFHKDSAEYGTGSQTANAIAVYMRLVDPAYKKAVVDNIVKDIRSRHNGLTAGDIGYHYLLKVLAEEGKEDVLFDMNDQSVSPGYGYQLAKGATALTESWQALPSVSNDHLMLGHIMEWFYEELAGIRQQEGGVAYRNIDIRPTPVGDVTSAGASYASVYGMISSKWTISGGDFILNVEIPANTTATIELPIGPGDQTEAVISEGEKSLKDRKDVRFLRFTGDRALISVGSGKYSFTVKSFQK